METKFNPNDERLEAGSGTWPEDNRRFDWHQRISWGAVIAGTIIAIFIHLTLSLLGVGIGASTASGGNGVDGGNLALGSAIWYIVSMLLSLFAGGWVAGRLAKDKHTSESVIHGLLVTGLMIILTFYLLSNAVGNILGGVTSMVGNNISSIQDRYQSSTNQSDIDTTQVRQDRATLERKAERIAGQAAEGAAKGALYGFAALLLSGVTGALGAKMGRDSKEPDIDHKKRQHQSRL